MSTVTMKRIFLIAMVVVLIFRIGNVISVGFEKYQCSRMLDAIESNDMEQLRNAAECGDPNSTLGISWLESLLFIESSRQTPLQAACEKGDFEMVKILVENGADVNYRPLNAHHPALNYAVDSDSEETLDIVRYLINNGVYADPIKRPTRSPVFILLNDNKLPPNGMEILKELMKVVKDKQSELYLKSACSWKHEEAIRFLVEEYGFDASNPYYLCAYCYGVTEYSRETFEYFLKRGADPYAKDEYGKCAIDYLKESSAPEWAETVAEMAKEYGFEG